MLSCHATGAGGGLHAVFWRLALGLRPPYRPSERHLYLQPEFGGAQKSGHRCLAGTVIWYESGIGVYMSQTDAFETTSQ